MRVIALAFALIVSWCAPAWSDSAYPSRTVRLIIPWPPGGTNDVLGRALAEHLGPVLGQRVIVDNRGGGNGIIGAEAVARAEPDGYTLMFHSITSHVTNAATKKTLRYNTITDFVPITEISSVAMFLIVNPSFPAKTLAELIAQAKAQPGALSYASFGTGSMGHLAGEMFKKMAGVDLVHVPYKGGAPAITDTIAGHVPMSFSGVGIAMPFIEDRAVRALAVTSAKRAPQLPDVPAIAETPGFAGYDATVQYAVWAPAKTPPEIISRLNRTISQVIRSAEFRKFLRENGLSGPVGSSPEATAQTIDLQLKKISELVAAANLKLD